uniref:DUF1501 domain-containing protein n=1 Tax=Ningiella ruwaisensis TaxID=2364274 RepID=UPI00109F58BB|nr:DUF1501 domain-containing protein [Ningiella ruwaisensis]
MPVRNVPYRDENALGAQLKILADMISVQAVLGQSRQVYFVGLGGWDTHDNQADLHPGLLATLSQALAAFNNDINALGKANEVTTITLCNKNMLKIK